MSKKGPRSGELWEQIRVEWERGASKVSLARKYELTTGAIDYHQKKDGWERVSDPVADIAGFVPDVDEPVIADPDPLSGAAAAKIAELEAKLAEAEAKVAEYKPTADLRLPSTPEGWIAYLGAETVSDMVEAQMASENIARFRKGLPQLDINDNPELKAQKVKELLAKRTAGKSKHVSSQYRLRTVKVQKRDGILVQIPVENQISNEAGQPGAAMWKAREAGDKLISPYLCQAYNCWEEAAVDDAGKLIYNGYCSAEHMAYDPYIGAKSVEGVTTSTMGVGGS